MMDLQSLTLHHWRLWMHTLVTRSLPGHFLSQTFSVQRRMAVSY